MLHEEFEALALRGNATIGADMYDSIERFYMSDSDYHREHGGRNETKQEFVKRVFGGKVNTPKTIAAKIAAESIKENRWCLRFQILKNQISKKRLDEMDTLIEEHYAAILKYDR